MGDVVGHKEYSSEGKIDPYRLDMNDERRRVQALMDNPGGAVTEPGVSDGAKLNDIWVQAGSGKPFPVRSMFQKVFYNIRDGKFWALAGLADIWNEVVWDGYVNPVDLLDGKDDPDAKPDSPNRARRGSLMSYVLATYRESTLARRAAERSAADTAAILELLRSQTAPRMTGQ
ncbi:hypothetical protein [Nocardia cyriacigeorgica]|uniref:hypothetical protein n=1 Tax=Nocardia cyriacigeorgica TaxID=135487 RepID=UPI00245526E9|nr:hypothetical protein [Nocardia cyriacigeorgica]